MLYKPDLFFYCAIRILDKLCRYPEYVSEHWFGIHRSFYDDDLPAHRLNRQRIENIQKWINERGISNLQYKSTDDFIKVIPNIRLGDDQNLGIANEAFTFYPSDGIAFRRWSDPRRDPFANPEFRPFRSSPVIFTKNTLDPLVDNLVQDGDYVNRIELALYINKIKLNRKSSLKEMINLRNEDLQEIKIYQTSLNKIPAICTLGSFQEKWSDKKTVYRYLMGFFKNNYFYEITMSAKYRGSEPSNLESLPLLEDRWGNLLSNKHLILVEPIEVPSHHYQVEKVKNGENLELFARRLIGEINQKRSQIKNPFPEYFQINSIGMDENGAVSDEVVKYLMKWIQIINGIDSVKENDQLKVPYPAGMESQGWRSWKVLQ